MYLIHERRRCDHLKWSQLAKISNNFHRNPRVFQTSFHGSPQNCKQVFTGVHGVPVTHKIYQEKLISMRKTDLEIQMLKVCFPLWVDSHIFHLSKAITHTDLRVKSLDDAGSDFLNLTNALMNYTNLMYNTYVTNAPIQYTNRMHYFIQVWK